MTSDPRRWPRVKEVFAAALACPPDRRAALLHEACGDDTALRDEVDSLLAAHADAGSFAERPAIAGLLSDEYTCTDVGAPAMAAGLVLGPYRILQSVAAGGMGEVYRALDTRLDREVAVKVLPTALSADPARIARLEREARLLAALNHPHIATIHGLEIAAGRHAIVMELVDGPTMADRLLRGPLALGAALDIGRQIAEALEAAHAKGIIHRDLKPANIILTPTGSVKVLDFGLATASARISRKEGEASAPPLGADGAPAGLKPRPTYLISEPRHTGGKGASHDGVAGTPAYMSPEQARGEGVDARTDVWAFGCVMYEMLTAHPAFGRAGVDETLAAVLDGEPDWQRLPTETPVGIRRLLRRCLSKDVRRRLHHIADARLEIEDAVADPEDRASAPIVTSGNRRRSRPLVAVAVLALALAVALGAWLLRRPVPPELRVVDIATPGTSDPWSFALSPDGRRVAFVADHDGQPTLWVRALDAADARVLTGTAGARRPFWSPDSRAIGFFASSELKRIEARGGAVQTVTFALGGTTAAWGPDGTILFSSVTPLALRRVNAAGGVVQAATRPAAESTGHRHPHFLPGGREFLFFVDGPDRVRGVYLGALGSLEATRLVASDSQGEYVAPGWLLFVRQGALLAQPFDSSRRTLRGEPITVADSVAFEPVTGSGAFSTSDAGVMAYRAGRPSVTRLSWFDRAGRALGAFGTPDQIGLSNLRLSPDDRRVAAERSLQNGADLWLLDSARQTRFTHQPNGAIARLPVWSPDGGRLAFESVRSGAVALSVKSSSDDGPEEVLFESSEIKVPSDWSPDGRFLLYYVPDPNTGTDLRVLPLDTRAPFVFLSTEANELWGQFSPDGRWVAYQSNETGRYEIYVRSFPVPGGPFPISMAGGVYPRWSRDGTELFFVAPDAKLMAVPVTATTTTIEAGTPTPLFQTRRLGGGSNVIGRSHQYDVARDGRFIINVETDATGPPITLLMNWKP